MCHPIQVRPSLISGLLGFFIPCSVALRPGHYEYGDGPCSNLNWTLAHALEPERQDGGASQIPRIVWFTHKSRDMLKDDFENKLQKLNPDFSLRFIDDDAAKDFIASTFPLKYLQTFNDIEWGPHKADFWRYLTLFVHGGYYIDTDDEILVPLEELAGSYDFVSVIAATAPKGVHIHNGIIATIPGNPILKQLLSHMINHPKPESTYPLSTYHYYVRYFYELMNSTLSNVDGGLRPLTPYTFMGMRMVFLYHEAPFRYIVNEHRRLVASMGTNKKQWTEGYAMPLYELIDPRWPFYLDMETKEYHPFLDDIQAHGATPLRNNSVSVASLQSATPGMRAWAVVNMLRTRSGQVRLRNLRDS